jgi:hypothetical protein
MRFLLPPQLRAGLVVERKLLASGSDGVPRILLRSASESGAEDQRALVLHGLVFAEREDGTGSRREPDERVRPILWPTERDVGDADVRRVVLEPDATSLGSAVSAVTRFFHQRTMTR